MVLLIFLTACKIPIDLKFQFILEGYFQLLLFVFQPNLNSVNKRFYKGFINKKILKWYVEQVELLKENIHSKSLAKYCKGNVFLCKYVNDLNESMKFIMKGQLNI